MPIELTKNQLTRHALASERGRYNLSCMSVEKDGVVQTDGRRLVFIKHAPDQTGPEAPIMLPAKTMKLAAGMITGKGKRAKVTQTDAETRVESALTDWRPSQAPINFPRRKAKKERTDVGERTLRIKDADDRAGTYPDWRAIMPSADAKGVFVSFDPSYMIAALQALVPQTSLECQAVTMFVRDKDSAVLCWAKDGSTALVMPIDADSQHDLAACPIVRPAEATAKKGKR